MFYPRSQYLVTYHFQPEVHSFHRVLHAFTPVRGGWGLTLPLQIKKLFDLTHMTI